MKWSNLRFNKCPKCDSDFIKSLVNVGDNNVGCRCGFLINKKKYQAIVAEQVAKTIDDVDDSDDDMEEPDFSGSGSWNGEDR